MADRGMGTERGLTDLRGGSARNEGSEDGQLRAFAGDVGGVASGDFAAVL